MDRKTVAAVLAAAAVATAATAAAVVVAGDDGGHRYSADGASGVPSSRRVRTGRTRRDYRHSYWDR